MENNKQISAIFLIQCVSSIAYAVFFSGLSLFLTQQKFFSVESATATTGLFLSLNYFLQLIGGISAQQFTSYKKFFCYSTFISSIGGLILFVGGNLYFGLALFLVSSLVNKVCLNMFITALFADNQIIDRKMAFIWSYTGSNLGFLLGYFLTGWFSIFNRYSNLFLLMSILLVCSAFFVIFFIKEDVRHFKKTNYKKTTSIINYLCMLALTMVCSMLLLNFADTTQNIVTFLSIILFGSLLYYSFKKCKPYEKLKFILFIIYGLLTLIFWSMYMLTPVAIMQLIKNDVNLSLFSITFAPQWLLNINSLVILIIAPQLALILKKYNKDLANIYYFILGFLFCSIGFLSLLFGFFYVSFFKISFWAIIGYLTSMTIAEIFISPMSNSLVGELVPESLHSIMTGCSSMTLAIGSLIASELSRNFILPFVNKKGLISYNLMHLEKVMFIIMGGVVLVTLSILICKYISKPIKNLYKKTLVSISIGEKL